ncbi:receptor-like serine/threonine-protein kinase ALE2 [Diospyros lotus]|uniref:receptor-like serine/threonine-protein kinase ALE2 n=1 Tax=Diospyros lotus TaxID=55363 RepID=UPI00224CAC50|nr:receptor-like serine/threonine-protein kinase ALE2 [Diospyros lotus]
MGIGLLSILELFAFFAVALAVEGSAGYDISPSPVSSSAISPTKEGAHGGIPYANRSNSSSPASMPNESVLHQPPVSAPFMSSLVPPAIKGIVPSLPPRTSTVLSPHSSPLPPSAPLHRIVPSLPPRTSAVLPPHSSLPPPGIPRHGIVPSLPPSAPKAAEPKNKNHVSVPVTPVASPASRSSQNLPTIHPIMPGSPPPSSSKQIAPETEAPLFMPIAPAPQKLLQKPPLARQPARPGVPPSIFTVPAAPPSTKPLPISPAIHPTIPDNPSSNLPAPPPSMDWKNNGIPVAAPPNETPDQFPTLNPSPKKAPSLHKPFRHSSYTASPLSSPRTPPDMGSYSPAPLPSTSVYKHHHARGNTSSPPTSSILLPPASSRQGHVLSPSPYSRKMHLKSRQKDYAPPPMNPGSFSSSPESSVSHAPLSSPIDPSGQTKLPSLSPRSSPPRSSARNPKMPLSPPILALPPPPPNEDCTSLTCVEPLTNTPPGSPCGCVLPMQVGLRLSVALYTFFPSVSEFAEEIAVGVFMKQNQVRIMGANAASQDPQKTIVLIDLVPLGEKIDDTTAYLTFQRFWYKQVAVRTSLFGDYEVLYVHYPGLPPSPPSSINVIDGGPYSGHGNNGRTIWPLGVDVRGQEHKHGLSGSVIAIIILSASMAVILCCVVAWIFLFKRREGQQEPKPLATRPFLSKPSGISASMFGSGPSSVSLSFGSNIATYTGSAKTFSSSDIQRATDNFNSLRILGEGGFGRVYSGILEDGTRVAVKVLKRDDQQGGREFLAEVEMLSRLHHRNLVKLIGICTEESTRCLVYELIPNGSVESHLHGVDKETAPLDWGARMKIALGAARGLAYLHEDSSPRVIHRDFKSSNILLEHDFMPKVSDFGLARTAMDEENKHISTRVMGTFGYVAPEYAMTGHLLVKSDVYSYGVVLLELLTGRKPVDMSQPPGQENLVAWARPLLTSKEGLESIIDPSIGPDFPFDSITKVAAIASMCVQPEVSHRPFMGEVVQALKLVCDESDEAREIGSRSCSQEDLSIDMDAMISSNSGQLPDSLQTQSPVSDYDPGFNVERGVPLSELFGNSARVGRQDSGSFRRHSSSGPLLIGRGKLLWQKMRRLSRGTVSEHGAMFRLWPESH